MKEFNAITACNNGPINFFTDPHVADVLPLDRMFFRLGKDIMGEIRDIFQNRSDENWNAGIACQERKYYNSAASRFYYAVYHAVVFWADRKQLISCAKSHAGMHQTLPEKVAEYGGPQGEDYREIFSEMYALRIQADYKPHPVKEKHLKPELLQRANTVRKVMLSHS